MQIATGGSETYQDRRTFLDDEYYAEVIADQQDAEEEHSDDEHYYERNAVQTMRYEGRQVDRVLMAELKTKGSF